MLRTLREILNKIARDNNAQLDDIEIRFPFTNIISVCKNLGISVFEDNIKEAGYIEYKKEGGRDIFNIYIREKDHIKRKMFTLAHELAHFLNDRDYLMQHGRIDRTEKEEMPNLSSELKEKEIKANNLAAELLMPEDEFTKKIQEGLSSEELSEYFGTSIESIGYRALNLGLRIK